MTIEFLPFIGAIRQIKTELDQKVALVYIQPDILLCCAPRMITDAKNTLYTWEVGSGMDAPDAKRFRKLEAERKKQETFG